MATQFTDLGEVLADLANNQITQPQPSSKTVRRRRRPAWAQSDAKLVAHLMAMPFMRPLLVAFMYWRMNIPVEEIADRMGISPKSVTMIIYRLNSRKRGTHFY